MVRWCKLFGEQYLGFWILGLVLFALQEVPYMVMPLFHLENNPIMNMQESSVLLDICEKVFGSSCIAVMTFIVQGQAEFFCIGNGINRIGFISAVIVLLLNYLGWWLYFNGHQSIGIMMFFIVLLPPLYYVCIGIWRQNPILFVTGIIFGVVHFTHVLGNLKN